MSPSQPMSVSPDHLSQTETKMTRTEVVSTPPAPRAGSYPPMPRDTEILLAELSSLTPIGAIEALLDRLERLA